MGSLLPVLCPVSAPFLLLFSRFVNNVRTSLPKETGLILTFLTETCGKRRMCRNVENVPECGVTPCFTVGLVIPGLIFPSFLLIFVSFVSFVHLGIPYLSGLNPPELSETGIICRKRGMCRILTSLGETES